MRQKVKEKANGEVVRTGDGIDMSASTYVLKDKRVESRLGGVGH